MLLAERCSEAARSGSAPDAYPGDRVDCTLPNTFNVPSYTRVDAAFFWKATQRMEVAVNVQNLGDMRYYDSQDNSLFPGAPRSVLGTVRMSFERGSMSARAVLVSLHRWTGLGIAGFLVVTGLTGAAIAWNDASERLFAPALFSLTPAQAARPAMDAFALRDAAARLERGYAVNNVDFTRRRDEPSRFSVEAAPGGPAPSNDEIALDPSTGRLLGARRRGDLRQGAVNLMPFLYDLHQFLALGGAGALVLGMVALIWTIDCFVGFWLTLPARAHPRRRPLPWLRRWRRAWRVRWPTRPFS